MARLILQTPNTQLVADLSALKWLQRNAVSMTKMPRFGSLGLLLLTLAVASIARADGEADTATIYLADGTRQVGVVRSISASELVIGRDPAVRFAIADVVRLEFPNHGAPPPRASLIQLANGDRIVAGLSSMSDESLVALWKSYPDLPPVQIPAAAIAGILVNVPDSAAERTRAFRQVFGRREKSDTVLLVNGDRLAGDLTSFDQAALKLSQAGKILQIELPRVRGIAFSSDLTSLPAPHHPRVAVTLGDGSQLTGWNANRDPGGPLRLSSLLASTLELPLSAVVAIRFLDGRTTYLSDLQPTESRLAPYFGSAVAIPPARDQNAAGGPLLVRGRQYCEGTGDAQPQSNHLRSGGTVPFLSGDGGDRRLCRRKRERAVCRRCGWRARLDESPRHGQLAPAAGRSDRRNRKAPARTRCRVRRACRCR